MPSARAALVAALLPRRRRRQSKLTWQAAAGVGYSFSWGEVSLLWRYLAYEMKSDKPTHDLSFNGPMLGATFSF
jgi:hypothetical protein